MSILQCCMHPHSGTIRKGVGAFTLFLCLTDLLSGGALAQSEASERKDTAAEEYARALLEGNLSNGRGFKSLYCRYKIYEGTGTTVKAAVAGDYSKKVVAEVEWVVDGENERWSSRGNDDAILKELDDRLKREAGNATQGKVSVGGWGVGSPSAHYLSNGNEQLRYGPSLGWANIYDRDHPITQRDSLPPGADGMGPGDKFNRAASLLARFEKGQSTYQGIEKHSGRDLAVIRSEYPERVQPARGVIMIDPIRGFLIVHEGYESAMYITSQFVTDARECANGCWFPLRTVTCITQRDTGTIRVREYVITEVSSDVPSDDKFRLDLPRGTGISDVRDYRTAFQIEAPMAVGLKDISALHERAKRTAIDKRAEEDRNSPRTSAWWWLVGGGAIVVVCLIALSRRRRAYHA